jgi:CNP1-like family
MMSLPARQTLCLLLPLLLPLSAGAERQGRGADIYVPPGFEEKTTKEATAVLPPPADTARDLLRVQVTGETSSSFYLAVPTLSVGEDQVVRFSLTIRNGSGGQQVSHVGLRCAGQQWKTYGILREDNTWRLLDDPQWQPIRARGYNNYQHSLASDICRAGYPVGDARAVIRRVRDPRVQDPRHP